MIRKLPWNRVAWYQSEIPLLSLTLCNWDDAKRWIYQGNLQSCKSFLEALSQTERGRNRGRQSRPELRFTVQKAQEVQEEKQTNLVFDLSPSVGFLARCSDLLGEALDHTEKSTECDPRRPLLKSWLICVPKVLSLMSAKGSDLLIYHDSFENGVIRLRVGKIKDWFGSMLSSITLKKHLYLKHGMCASRTNALTWTKFKVCKLAHIAILLVNI